MSGLRAQVLPLLAAVLFLLAVVGFGMTSPDFGHMRHPVALLGAAGEPNALAFNLLGFVVSGLLLAWQAWHWRSASSAHSWGHRIGLQLLMMSALAFMAQGLLPMDPTNLLAPASRLHSLAWTVWWLAFAPGALLVALTKRRGSLPALLLVLAMLVVVLVVSAGSLLPAPLAQRLAFAGWFGWWIVAGFAFSRASTSIQGSSPPARR